MKPRDKHGWRKESFVLDMILIYDFSLKKLITRHLETTFSVECLCIMVVGGKY